MTIQKEIGTVFLFIGIIIFILALSADFIGVGYHRGFGYKQISSLIVGAIAIIVGVYLKRKK